MSGIVKRHARHQDELNRRLSAAMGVIDDPEAIRRYRHRRRWRAVGGAVAWAIGVTLLVGSLGWLVVLVVETTP